MRRLQIWILRKVVRLCDAYLEGADPWDAGYTDAQAMSRSATRKIAKLTE